jgi:WD40 repeat protein
MQIRLDIPNHPFLQIDDDIQKTLPWQKDDCIDFINQLIKQRGLRDEIKNITISFPSIQGRSSAIVLKVVFNKIHGPQDILIIRALSSEKANREKDCANKLNITRRDCFANLTGDFQHQNYDCLIYDDIAISTAWTDNIYDLGTILKVQNLWFGVQSEAQRSFGAEQFQEFARQLTANYKSVETHHTRDTKKYIESKSLWSQLPPDFVIAENFSLHHPTTQQIIFGDAPAVSPKIVSIRELERELEQQPLENQWIQLQEAFFLETEDYTEDSFLTGNSSTAYLRGLIVSGQQKRVWLAISKTELSAFEAQLKPAKNPQGYLLTLLAQPITFTAQLENRGFAPSARLSITEFWRIARKRFSQLAIGMCHTDLHCGNVLTAGINLKAIDVGDMDQDLLATDIARLEISLWFELAANLTATEARQILHNLALHRLPQTGELSPQAIDFNKLLQSLRDGFQAGLKSNDSPTATDIHLAENEIELAYVIQILLYQRYSLLDGMTIPPAFNAVAQFWLQRFRRENPYLGLAAFQTDDAMRFFGRDTLIAKLVTQFETLHQQDQPRLLAILGPSGAGKSSVARAGLIPKLKLHPTFSNFEIQSIDHPGEFISEMTKELPKPNQPCILFIDQFEEIYTINRKNDNSQATDTFIEHLLTAIQDKTDFSVILTLRSDFLGETHRHAHLNKMIAEQHKIVSVMSQDELRAAITQPAILAGQALDDAVIEQLLEQTAGREGALPLLQFALSQIWEGLRNGTTAAQTLKNIGGVGGALAQKAESIYRQLSESEQAITKHAFLQLIQLGEGALDTRRRITVETIVPHNQNLAEVKMVLDKFADPTARLMTLSQKQEQVTAEITHEALLIHWKRLKNWIEQGREDLRFLERLKSDVNRWEAFTRDKRLLWHSPDLDSLQNYHQRAAQTMTEPQIAFFNASKREQQKTQRFKRIIFAGLVGLVFALSIGIYWALHERERAQLSEQRAEAQKNKALRTQSLFLADLSRQQTEQGNAANGILLALEALPTEKQPARPYVVQAATKLYQAVLHLQESQVITGHRGSINHIAFSPDGQRIVTASDDNTASLWDAQSGQLLKVLDGHTSRVRNAAFSPDGQHIVTASSDNTARLWDAQSGQLLKVLKGHTDNVWNAAFSPDGQRIVTASDDNTASLWDAQSGQLLKVLDGHTSRVRNAAFSPDGQHIVTASDDNTARLWDAQSGQLLKVLDGHTSLVINAAFSPDGQRIVTASWDNTARLWDAQSGQLLKVLDGHTSLVRNAAFSPDGQRIVTASWDNTIRLWDVQSGQLFKLEGHTGIVWNAAFSPDGQRIVTASRDNTARLWDTKTGQQLYMLEGHISPFSVINAAFSPDNQRIVTASDKTARIWNVKSGQLLKVLDGHTEKIWNAAFSPDGQRIVTASRDNTARLWDAQSGQLLQVLEGHTDRVLNAAFSPDGQRIVTASEDNTARLWEVNSGQLLQVLEGHSGRRVWSAAFSSDGQRIVTVSYTAHLWDAKTGQQIQVLEGHTSGVINAAFSPDGQRIVTASSDNTARLWDVQSGQQIYILEGHTSLVRNAVFSPDGQRIVTASDDNTARIWPVFSTQELIDHAKQIVPRCLTPKQREQFFLLPDPSDDLIEAGEQLAKTGDIKGAAAKFKAAKALAPCHKFEPEDKARQTAAMSFIDKARKSKEDGLISQAIWEFNQAQQIDPRFRTEHLIAELQVQEGKESKRTPQSSQSGNYQFELKRDNNGNLIYKAYFDEQGNPTTHENYGFHLFTQQFDEQSNFMEFAAFDIAEHPTLYKDGYHKFTKRYKNGGQHIEWAYFDINNQPIVPNNVSYHKLVRKFDEQGRVIEDAYFDAQGRLIKKEDGQGNLME